MKTPRVHDFDPNANIPQLGSPMENFPAIQKPQPKTLPVPPVRDVPLVPPVPLVRDVRPVPPRKRVMKQRHPFDIYLDQYESLQKLALEERKQGGVGSMSAMVRQALDTLIEIKTKQKK